MHPLTLLALGCAVLLVPGHRTVRLHRAAVRAAGSPVARATRPAPSRARGARGALVAHRRAPSIALVAAVGVGAAAGSAAGPAIGVSVGVAVACAALLGRAAVVRRAGDRATAELKTALDLLAAELAAGAAPATALAAAADAAPAHAAALRTLGRGLVSGDPDPPHPVGPLDPALAALHHAWHLSATTGAPLAAVCQRVADDVRRRIEQRRAVAAALAGARSTAALLAVLPVLGVLLGAAMQAQPLAVLFTTSTGGTLLAVGTCLDAAGLAWTHWLAARAEGP